MYQVFKFLKKSGYTLSVCVCFTSNLLFGQQQVNTSQTISPIEKKHADRGDLLFSMGPLKYEFALQEYEKALETNPDNFWLNYKLGLCYLNITKFKSRSIKYLEKANLGDAGKNATPEIRFSLAKAYEMNQKPEQAIEQYKQYISEVKTELHPDSNDITKARKRIEKCNRLIIFYSHPSGVVLKNMGDSINSPYAEYDPFVTSDDSTMYFTSRRPDTKGGQKDEIDGEYYEDIYVSHKKNGKWQLAKRTPNINRSHNDAITGLSADGKKMFIYKDANGGDICMSILTAKGWSKPRSIKEINSDFHESSASLSPDGKTLYFVSDRTGGEGGKDIYSSNLEPNSKWGKPVNLGPDINTPEDEERAFIDPDGKTLFFSSKGHNSIGGFDIFRSTFENGKWSEPQNLGYPINDVEDDFSFIRSTNERFGYYASLKENGKGDKDIYFIDFGENRKDTTLNSRNPLAQKDSARLMNDPLALAKTDEPNSNTDKLTIKRNSNPESESNSKPNMDNTNPGQPKTDQTGTTGSNKNQLNSNTDKQADKTNTDKQADKTNTDKQADKTNPSDKTQPNTNQTKSNNPSDKQNTNQDSNIKSNGDKTNPSNPSLQLNNETILSGKDSLAQLNSKATASNKIKDKTSTSGAVTNSMNAISNEYSEASNPEITDSSLFNNILFEFNKQTFNEAGRTELDRLVAYLNKHTLNAVKATGHADAVGGDAYNLVLSQKRAMQVAAYIVSKGINQNRIKVDYKGKARPVAPNENPDKSDNPDGRRLNRRVELEILNK